MGAPRFSTAKWPVGEGSARIVAFHSCQVRQNPPVLGRPIYEPHLRLIFSRLLHFILGRILDIQY